MARKNNLAALAALAGLGYALTSQSRNKVDLSEREDSNPDRKARPESTENRLKSQAQSIAEADKSSKATSMANNEPSAPAVVVPDATKNNSSANSASAQTAKVNNQPPLVITKKLENLPVEQSAGSLKDRNPPVVITKELKNLPDVRTNFGSLINYHQVNNKATTNEAAKQAAIAATQKHNEAGEKVKDGRYKQMDADILNNMITNPPMKKGGAVKMASGGMTSSASRRGDGIATKGKTRGKIC